MRVNEIMTANPAFCTPDTSLRVVARLMVAYDCGEIPVVDGRVGMRLVGVLTDRDITCRALAQGRNPLELTAADVMTEPCVAIPLDTDLTACRLTLETLQVRRLPVVDEAGKCCGIVSQADIAQFLSDGEAAEVLKKLSQPTTRASAIDLP